MAGNSPEEIKAAMRTYLKVGIVLFVGTVITVLVAVVPAFDLGDKGFSNTDKVVGLLIASVKASVVMYFLMHLNHEKKMVYCIFAGSIFFGLCLYFITRMGFIDPITAPSFFSGLAS